MKQEYDFSKFQINPRVGETNYNLTSLVMKIDDGYVSFCPELEISSQGDTFEHARANLVEAVELFLEAASPEEVKQKLHEEDFKATSKRDMVISLAKVNLPKAREKARGIQDFWFKAQALAWIAWYSDDDDFNSDIFEAVKASFSNEDPYKIVASSAWSLRAMIERGRKEGIQKLLADVLAVSDKIENYVNRADALFLVWQAIFPMGKEEYVKVLEPLVKSCIDAKSWKGPVILCRITRILASEDVQAARDFVDRLEEARIKEKASRCLDRGESYGPREFFWDRY